MSGLVTNNPNTAIKGCEPGYLINYDHLDTDRPFQRGDNSFEFYRFLGKIQMLSLDILSQQAKFKQLKDKYDPKSTQGHVPRNLMVDLDQIQNKYYSFAQRKFALLNEYGGLPFNLEQEAIFKTTLTKINKQMSFFDNVTILNSQVLTHCKNLNCNDFCIIL